MKRKVQFYLKVMRLIICKRLMPGSTIMEDYNVLAPTYDDYFSKYIGPHSREMVKRLSIVNGARVLDLACGTGVITAEILKYTGKAIAIDASEGMIKQAKAKTNGSAEFIHGDMLKIIDQLPSNYFDYVTCGWAIGYSQPAALLKKIKRILKPGGKIGIIENRKDTLAPLRESGIKVMQKYPQHIRYLMDLPIRLPKNEDHLKSLYLKSGLKPLEVWGGEIKFNFHDGSSVLNWALHTGASAGFDKVMDIKAKDLCDKAFVEIIERDYQTYKGIDISHKFVAGVAQK